MHRLFVSDLHLSDDTPDIEAALIALLKRESPFDSLVMLGDIFEAWVGDDDDSPFAERIRLAIRAVSEAGTEVRAGGSPRVLHARCFFLLIAKPPSSPAPSCSSLTSPPRGWVAVAWFERRGAG